MDGVTATLTGGAIDIDGDGRPEQISRDEQRRGRDSPAEVLVRFADQVAFDGTAPRRTYRPTMTCTPLIQFMRPWHELPTPVFVGPGGWRDMDGDGDRDPILVLQSNSPE